MMSYRSQTDVAFENLALAIVAQAIKDYRKVKRRSEKATDVKNIENYTLEKLQLEYFFCSKWCDFLLSTTTLTGKDILDRL